MKSYSAIIPMKATEQYFLAALFMALHKVVLTVTLSKGAFLSIAFLCCTSWFCTFGKSAG